MRAEQLGGEGDRVAVVERVKGGRRTGDGTGTTAELGKLLHQPGVRLLCVVQGSLELLVLHLEGLNLEPLALPRRLGSTAVAQNAFHTTLLLLILSLGSFPGRQVGLGLGKDLTPGLALLGPLLVAGGSLGERHIRVGNGEVLG